MIDPLRSCVMIFLFLPAATDAIVQADTPKSYADLYHEAEALCAGESYAEAYERYAVAKGLQLTDEQSRWVRFRLGDCLWRAQPSDQQGSPVEDQVLALLLGLVLDSERDGRGELLYIATAGGGQRQGHHRRARVFPAHGQADFAARGCFRAHTPARWPSPGQR